MQEKSHLASLPEAEEPAETVATPAKTSTVPLNDATDCQETPVQNTPIRPEPAEMHPAHHQSSTTKPLEDARWLGFMEKGAKTEPSKGGTKIPMLQNTPTKLPKMPGTFRPPDFQFTFRHPSLELSPAAQKLMDETRKEAAKLRAQAPAEDSGLPTIQEQIERKIATPRARTGRFSNAHMAEFKKMDSIANHPSSFRTDPNRFKQSNVSLKRTSSKADLDKAEAPEAKSIKPCKSRINGNEPEDDNKDSKPNEFKIKTSGLEAASPTKRFKAHHGDDTFITRPVSRDDTQQPKLNKSYLPTVVTTPTKSSLARSDSVKSSKSGIPSLACSPSKHSVAETSNKDSGTAPLLAQSPSKVDASYHTESDQVAEPPLLARSPSKKPVQKHSSDEIESGSVTPLLSRSPSKKPGNNIAKSDSDEPQISSTPLLSRSPSKKAPQRQQQGSNQSEQSSSIPLLSRTPAKLPIGDESPFKQPAKPAPTPSAPSSSLRDRFTALRGASSAMKSILRSPQRLYSDDPFKIAAGTHVAIGTPPRSTVKSGENREPPTVASAKKHVDFDNSPTVGKRVIGSPSPVKAHSKLSDQMDVTYPSLPPRSPLPTETYSDIQLEYPNLNLTHIAASSEGEPEMVPSTVSPTVPGTFTFRAGTPITFGPAAASSNYQAASQQSQRPLKPTIRHVRSSIAPQPSRHKDTTRTEANYDNGKGMKRKLSTTEEEGKENAGSASAALSVFDIPDDDVDSGEMRPVKKQRRGEVEGADKGQNKGKPGSRTPKSGQRKGFLSQARLNMLATPKRRRG